MFPAGFEPATLRVWDARDNHYTTETSYSWGKKLALSSAVAKCSTKLLHLREKLNKNQKISGSLPTWPIIKIIK